MQIKTEKVEKSEHHISSIDDDGVSGRRSAVIYFTNGEFTGCTFKTHRNPYSYKDWMFLGSVAIQIKGLVEEVCKK